MSGWGMSIGASALVRMKPSKLAFGACDMPGDCVALMSRTVSDVVSSTVILPSSVVVVIRVLECTYSMPTKTDKLAT